MNKKLKTIIVDDEELARESLKDVLLKFPDIEIIAESSNGFEAIKDIQKLRPDLVFLDIDMPKLDGFDVIEVLEDPPFIVFVTAFNEYAIKAFETEAVDYLLKPVSAERLDKTIEKIKLKVRDNARETISNLINSHGREKAPIERILIKENFEVIIIPVEDILYIEAQDDYVEVHTIKGGHLKHERISRLEELLDPKSFCRIHRSYIINIDYLSKIEPAGRETREAVLKNGRRLPISKSGYKKIMEFL
jgi:two-component system LytT family response regulator